MTEAEYQEALRDLAADRARADAHRARELEVERRADRALIAGDAVEVEWSDEDDRDVNLIVALHADGVEVIGAREPRSGRWRGDVARSITVAAAYERIERAARGAT